MRDAHTIAECLHSFCKVCLYRHFESCGTINNGYCPSCRVSLGPDPVKRAKFDVALQSLFDKLLPQFADEDMTLREAELIVSEVSKRIDPSSHIIWGARIEKTNKKSSIRVLVVLAGAKFPHYELQSLGAAAVTHADAELDLDLLG